MVYKVYKVHSLQSSYPNPFFSLQTFHGVICKDNVIIYPVVCWADLIPSAAGLESKPLVRNSVTSFIQIYYRIHLT